MSSRKGLKSQVLCPSQVFRFKQPQTLPWLGEVDGGLPTSRLLPNGRQELRSRSSLWRRWLGECLRGWPERHGVAMRSAAARALKPIVIEKRGHVSKVEAPGRRVG